MEGEGLNGLRKNINSSNGESIPSCITYSSNLLDNVNTSSGPVTYFSELGLRLCCDNVNYYYFRSDYFKQRLWEFQELQAKITSKALKWSSNFRKTEMSETSKHLLAGAMAGAVSRTCTAPLDRLKVILQASHGKKFTLKGTFLKMMNEGGLFSFWRGNGINVIKIVPEMALKFSIYNEVKLYMKVQKNIDKLDICERLLAGSVAGVISQSVLFPLEVVKTRMVLRKTGESCWSCIHDICLNKRGLYIGYLPNLIGIIPYAGIDLAIYETLKGMYMSRMGGKEDPQVVVLLCFGIVSSSCASVISYPLNLIKIRLQAQRVNLEADHSMSATFRNIVISDGISGLYKGLLANLLKVAPSVGMGYVVYELSRTSLGATMS